MKEYVLVYASPGGDSPFIAILKDRPVFQRGKWNLPGGKVEPGEEPIAAALRELMEECGVVGSSPEILGRIMDGEEYVIYVIRCIVELSELSPRDGETERPAWMTPEEFSKVPTVGHVRTTASLCRFGLGDWTMTEVIGYHAAGEQSFRLTFPKG